MRRSWKMVPRPHPHLWTWRPTAPLAATPRPWQRASASTPICSPRPQIFSRGSHHHLCLASLHAWIMSWFRNHQKYPTTGVCKKGQNVLRKTSYPEFKKEKNWILPWVWYPPCCVTQGKSLNFSGLVKWHGWAWFSLNLFHDSKINFGYMWGFTEGWILQHLDLPGAPILLQWRCPQSCSDYSPLAGGAHHISLYSSE